MPSCPTERFCRKASHKVAGLQVGNPGLNRGCGAEGECVSLYQCGLVGLAEQFIYTFRALL